MFTFNFTRGQRWGSKIWPQPHTCTNTHLTKHTSRSIILTKCYKHIKQKTQIYTWTKGWRRGSGGKQILFLKTLELNWFSIDTFLQIISLYQLIAIITYGVYNFNTRVNYKQWSHCFTMHGLSFKWMRVHQGNYKSNNEGYKGN